MERRGEQEQEEEMGGNKNPIGGAAAASVVKLPLAPTILSTTPSDHRRLNHAMVSIRRGSSIFSPTQTLQPYIPPPPPPHASPDPPPPDPTPIPPLQLEVTPIPVRYTECLKNHAASMGAHVVDGCGEFMPSGDHGTPEALKCAACDCHRNFHRREVEAETPPPPPPRPRFVAPPPTMVNFGGGAAESSSEDLDMYQPGGQPSSSSRKRFRTKFRQDQKERMHELAVRLGWRIQKENEQEVQQFCSEVGVKRQVLKVWMHNNKQAINNNKRRMDHTSHG